jgi:hypothetical protein
MSSDNFTPRLLGFMFVFVALASLLSGLILGPLSYSIVGPPDNISETMINFSDNPTTVQMSIAGYLIEAAGIVLLTVLLYTTLKKQNKIIARWAFGLWIVEAVFVAFRQISTFSLLFTSQEFVKAGAPDSSYFQTLGGLFFGSTQFIYSAQMVFYCIGGILFYYLFFKSKFVPRVLSLWGIIAASLGFIGTLFEIFNYDVPMYIFLPLLPFELAIGVWLMVKGFNSSAINSPSTKTELNEIK